MADAFFPTDEDKAAAAAAGHPIRVSVWDARRTAPAEAFAYRGAPDAVVFALPVAHVLAQPPPPPLAVVEDPDGVPDRLPPRAREGHAGIEVLDRRAGEPKVPWKKRVQKVADAAQRVPHEA